VAAAPRGPEVPLHLLETAEYFDAFGFDPSWYERWMRICKLYFRWLRVRVEGLENVPNEGPALLIGNHAGARFHEGNSLQYAVRRLHPAQRIVRPLVAWQTGKFMVAGHFTFQYAGSVVEHPRNADHLLRHGELALVYPEGSWSTAKSFRERNQLCSPDRWGNSFVRTALRNRVPVIPVAAHGFEAAVPTLWQSRLLARFWKLRIGTQPVSPQSFLTLGHPQATGLFPFPVRCRISVGEPIDLLRMAPPGGIRTAADVRAISLAVRKILEGQLSAMAAERRRR
jgi:1-acyl-sn-glycerol-3-phosphate acyltransferase